MDVFGGLEADGIPCAASFETDVGESRRVAVA